jgi:hypothetical protein
MKIRTIGAGALAAEYTLSTISGMCAGDRAGQQRAAEGTSRNEYSWNTKGEA